MKLQKNKLLSTIAISFILILASSIFLAVSNPKTTVANAQTLISSNLLQYEWKSPAASPDRSFYSAGPAPNSPNILWKASIPTANGFPVAFNGKVFVADAIGNTYALDASTGKLVWVTNASAGLAGGMSKIDENYMVLGSTCVKISDGTIVWVGPPGFLYDQSVINGAGYIPELKMFVDNTYGWNLPDPSKPPTLAWNRTSQQNVGHGYDVYGDGKLFIGAEDGFLRAVDAKTGTTLWTTPLTAAFNYGASYYNGMVIQGGLDNNMRAWDADTGKLLWTYNPGTWYGQWASASGVAYGMVYEHNQDNYVYAINATSGQLVWRQNGPGIGYSNTLSIADGKVYVQMGENQYRDFATGQYASSEFDCFDAYTGKLIWTLPIENGAPFNQQCIAYGNLYIIPTSTPSVPGVWTYSLGGGGSLGEVWCISSGAGSAVKDWPMFMSDPAHTGEGAGPTQLAVKWKFPTGAMVVSAPTAVNGVVYFGSLDSNIYAVDANNGGKIWNFKTGFPAASSPAVVNGKLYTGADDGNIYCLDAATGTKIWETPAGGITNNLLGSGTYLTIEPPVRSSPTVVGSNVYVGSLDGNLYCLDANTGNVLWKFPTNGPIFATPAVADNAVYFTSSAGGYPIGFNPPSPNGDLYKLNANSGSVIWHNSIPYVLDRTLGWGNFLFASPTVADGMVFVRNGFLYNYAIDANTGATIWTYTAMFNPGTPFQSGGVVQMGAPLYAHGALYINDYYDITCLNAANGSVVWQTYLSREDISQAITYSYNRVYAVTEARVLYTLDAQTGAKLSYYDQFGGQMHSAPTPYNGNLYVGSNDWNLYCFTDPRLIITETPAQSPSPVSSPSPATSPQSSPSITEATPMTTYALVAAVVIVILIIAVAAVVLRRRK